MKEKTIKNINKKLRLVYWVLFFLVLAGIIYFAVFNILILILIVLVIVIFVGYGSDKRSKWFRMKFVCNAPEIINYKGVCFIKNRFPFIGYARSGMIYDRLDIIEGVI